MTTMVCQITSLTVVYSTVYSDADQRKHQSSASLAFVWGIHRDRWILRTKGQLRGKCFHLMTSSWGTTTTQKSFPWRNVFMSNTLYDCFNMNYRSTFSYQFNSMQFKSYLLSCFMWVHSDTLHQIYTTHRFIYSTTLNQVWIGHIYWYILIDTLSTINSFINAPCFTSLRAIFSADTLAWRALGRYHFKQRLGVWRH